MPLCLGFCLRVGVYLLCGETVYRGGKSEEVRLLLEFQELQNIAASEGQVVVLECRVRGAPPMQVQWFRQGSEIHDSPDFRILQKSKKRCRFSRI